MHDLTADVAIIGAGFGGSLTALLCQRIGLHPVLIERGTHPRFAIGESSTPVADLILGQLARRYDLPQLIPLTHYGSWKRTYPDVACGLKRGFSYFHHQRGEPFVPCADHANELLVTANPDAERGDTHWYRADVDHFFVRQILTCGIPYFDQTEIEDLSEGEPWHIRARRGGNPVSIRASFLVDASGPAGVIARHPGIPTNPAGLRTHSRTVFSHFKDVPLWSDTYAALGGRRSDHPFPCDAAALHHVFDGGWMWVLRFDNGITSAGFVIDDSAQHPHPNAGDLDPQQEWEGLLRQFPSIARQFDRATPVQTFRRTDRLQRRAARTAGPTWAMLPHTAYFLDPWFSGGNAHTMCGIERLIAILNQHRDSASRTKALAEYDRLLQAEIDVLDMLIHGCYRAFNRFELMTAFSMLYFAAAITTEERRRAGLYRPQEGFLLSGVPAYRAALAQCYAKLTALTACEAPTTAAAFHTEIADRIAPFNTAGLADPTHHNMYPYTSAGPQAFSAHGSGDTA